MSKKDYEKDESEIEKKIQEIEEESKKEAEEETDLLDREVTLQDVYDAFEKIGAVSREIIDIVMAAYLSSLRPDFIEVPLWVVLVGAPSSFKTELVKTLKGLPGIYYLDTLTSNPFASGYVAPKGRKSYDLLDELDEKCLVIRDMTTLFSLNEETVKKLLGELVSIYDGDFTKFSPTRGKKDYKATFSLIGCITPAALNKHRRYIDMIGSRFLFIRLPELTKERQDKGFQIAWQKDSRKALIQNAKQTICTYLARLQINQLIIDEADQDIQESLNGLANLISRGRGIVITKSQTFKDDTGAEQSYYEIEDVQIEEPWRALLQTRGFARCLAVVRGRRKITREDIETVANISLSSMPVDRAEVVKQMFLNLGNRAGLSSKEIHGLLPHRSQRTFQRLCKELESLGIVNAFKDPNVSANQPWKWFLQEDIKGALSKAYGLKDKETIPQMDKQPAQQELLQEDIGATESPNDAPINKE